MTGLLSELVGRSARSRPDGIAVIDGDHSVTYAELDRRVDGLAGTLHQAGVGPADRVGLYLDKSVHAVAAVHAVLRTGAAYVPLDPKAPTARLAIIAADCGLEVIVTAANKQGRWAGLLAEGAPLRCLVVADADAGDVAAPPGITVVAEGDAADPPSPAHAAIGEDDLAYILYTSGSTGRPKGVMLTHRNGWAFVDWAVQSLGVTAADRLSSHAPFHFDLSIFDLFAAAAAAAPLVLVPTKATVFPAEAAKFIETHELTVWYSVPSALSMMVAKGGLEAGRLPTLRTVVFAGEVFPTPYLSSLMEILPGVEFWNWYGPTETNVCTAYRIPQAPPADDPPVPIGWCIEADEAAVVDEGGADVTPGEEGELLIRGATVTPGYWGDDERTAERLISRAGGPRWYRTGDLVVEEPGSGYRFRGRRDHQIKSRGHRIELGEIEAALHRHGSVAEAAVVAVPDPLVTNVLHGYAVVSDDTGHDALLAHCRALLPSYMVPATIALLPGLPRTSTGKIDRVALREQADAEAESK